MTRRPGSRPAASVGNARPAAPPPPPFTAATRARLKAAAERREGGFVLEGRKLVADALETGVAIEELWLADDLDPAVAQPLADRARERGARVGTAAARDLDRTSDVVTPQGVLALAADPARAVGDVVRARGPLVLLDGVQDPGNVGAVLRAAAAFRFAGALVSGGTADPTGPKAMRASAGAALATPFARGAIEALVTAVRGAGRALWLLDGVGTSLWDVKPAAGADATTAARAPVLVVGSEGRGASEAARAAASLRVAIPISPTVESLNAAVAFGIAAAHLARLLAPAPASPAPSSPTPSRSARPPAR